MIQIIKPPTKTYQDTKMRKHFRCKHCGTEWIADPADYDAKKASVWINDIEQWEYLTICPVCGWSNLFEYFDENKTWEDIPYGQTDVETFY